MAALTSEFETLYARFGRPSIPRRDCFAPCCAGLLFNARLVVETRLTLAPGTAEREAALKMVADRPGNHQITPGADKAYDVAEFVADLRDLNATPHVAQNTTSRRSAINRRTTCRSGTWLAGGCAAY